MKDSGSWENLIKFDLLSQNAFQNKARGQSSHRDNVERGLPAHTAGTVRSGREQKEWLLEKLGAKELRVAAYSSLSFKPEDVIYQQWLVDPLEGYLSHRFGLY